MSYKNVVLNDHPTSFYLLDEVRSGSVGSYSGIISQFATYQDLKDSGLTYSGLSGLPVYDYSGNVNDGYAVNTSNKPYLQHMIKRHIRNVHTHAVIPLSLLHLGAMSIANPVRRPEMKNV